MFTLILFLSVIAIFIWATNRFKTLELHLEGLERKLKEVRTALKPAQEAIPGKPAPYPVARRSAACHKAICRALAATQN
jgi:hypothetical protein